MRLVDILLRVSRTVQQQLLPRLSMFSHIFMANTNQSTTSSEMTLTTTTTTTSTAQVNNQLDCQFDKLNTDITSGTIAKYLDKQAISRISQTSKRMHALFQPASCGIKGLQSVIEAEYFDVYCDMIVINEKTGNTSASASIFDSFLYQNRNGSYERTSYIKFAVKEYNTYMWMMFLKSILCIDVNAKLHLRVELPVQKDLEKYKDSYILRYPDFYYVNVASQLEEKTIVNQSQLQRFFEQVLLQETHIDLTALFEEFHHCNESLYQWIKQQITDEQFQQALLNLAKNLREALPRHMFLQLSCAENWLNNQEKIDSAKFDVNENPYPDSKKVTIKNFFGNKVSIFPLVPHRGLGYDFALIRTKLNACQIATIPFHPNYLLKYGIKNNTIVPKDNVDNPIIAELHRHAAQINIDALILSKLLETRKIDFTHLHEQARRAQLYENLKPDLLKLNTDLAKPSLTRMR